MPGMPNIEIVAERSRIPFDLLKLADPSSELVNAYLKSGTCYVATLNSEAIGVMVLSEVDAASMEIKNIAVKASARGKGYGRMLLRHATVVSQRSGYEKLIIGTGNSSIRQLSLYQQEGFEIVRIIKDFFIKHYQEPIFEDGIQCKHMIVLEKDLKRWNSSGPFIPDDVP